MASGPKPKGTNPKGIKENSLIISLPPRTPRRCVSWTLLASIKQTQPLRFQLADALCGFLGFLDLYKKALSSFPEMLQIHHSRFCLTLRAWIVAFRHCLIERVLNLASWVGCHSM